MTTITDDEVAKRFKKALDLLKSEFGINYKNIAAKMGYDIATVTKIKNGSYPVSPEHIERLYRNYNQINKDYIYYGNGEVFANESKENYGDTIINKNGSLVSTKTPKTLAIYDLDVKKGTITLIDDVSRNPDATISFLGADDCDFAVKVHGESMTGKISNGGIIAVKEIRDLDVIPFGHIFLIFTTDLRIIRFIQKSKKGESYVKLVSNNSEQYEDFDIERSKIHKLFMVKKILNDEA